MQKNCTNGAVKLTNTQEQRTIATIAELLNERGDSIKIVVNVSGSKQRRIKIEVTRYIEVPE